MPGTVHQESGLTAGQQFESLRGVRGEGTGPKGAHFHELGQLFRSLEIGFIVAVLHLPVVHGIARFISALRHAGQIVHRHRGPLLRPEQRDGDLAGVLQDRDAVLKVLIIFRLAQAQFLQHGYIVKNSEHLRGVVAVGILLSIVRISVGNFVEFMAVDIEVIILRCFDRIVKGIQIAVFPQRVVGIHGGDLKNIRELTYRRPGFQRRAIGIRPMFDVEFKVRVFFIHAAHGLVNGRDRRVCIIQIQRQLTADVLIHRVESVLPLCERASGKQHHCHE